MNDTRNSLKREELQSTPIAEEQEAGPVVGEPVGNRRESQQEKGVIIIIRARFPLSSFPQA